VFRADVVIRISVRISVWESYPRFAAEVFGASRLRSLFGGLDEMNQGETKVLVRFARVA
jgi:hypothetical protein